MNPSFCRATKHFAQERTENDCMTRSNALSPRSIPAHLCAAALMLLLLWMPLGRSLAPWLAWIVITLLICGLLINRFTLAVRVRHMPLLMAFAASSVCSAWLSPFSEISLRRGASGFLLMLVFPAAQLIAANARALMLVRRTMLAAILLCALDIAWQYAFGRSMLLGVAAPVDRYRYSGSLANPNEVAFIALLLPLALCNADTTRAKSTRVLSIALACFGVLLTSSRTTLGGMFVGANVNSWFGTRRFLKWSLAIALAVSAVAWIGDFGSFRKRVGETLHPQDEIRLQTWRIAFDAFVERPLLGQGPAVFFEVNEASRKLPQIQGRETPAGGMPWVHNIALELLTERGAIGAALFAALVIAIICDLHRGLASVATRKWSAALAASLATFAAMSMLDLSLLKDWCSVCLWLSAGFAASVAQQNSEEPQGVRAD